MNIEQLQLIDRNETVNTLLRLFVSSNIKSNVTNLDSFLSHLIKTGNIINTTNYHKFFNDLAEAGVGTLTELNGKPNSRFISNFSLKDVSEQILYPNKYVNLKPIEEGETMSEGKRGRPKGSRNVPEEIKEENGEIKKRGRPKGYRKPAQEVLEREVVFMFRNSRGQMLPFNLNDAEQLIKQVQEIKSQIA